MAKETQNETNEAQPVQPVQVHVTTESDAAYERKRQETFEATIDEARRLRMDYAPNGGRFIVAGRLVDANGNPVTEA